MKINNNHRKFIKLYLENNNRAESYFNTYKVKSRQQRTSLRYKLLQNIEIKELLEEEKIKLEEKEKRKEEREYKKIENEVDEKNKWKEKRDKIILSFYTINQSKTAKEQDKINAGKRFMRATDKYEIFEKTTEEEKEKLIKNQFELLNNLAKNGDLTEFENLKINED